MSGFPILDLILGLVFIFFVLSIISSAVVEAIITRREYRNKILTQWLLNIFDKKMVQPDGKIVKLGQAIFDHCLTTGLSKSGKSTAFMDAKNFVSALFEKLTFDPDNPGKIIASLDELTDAIKTAKAIDGTTVLSTELLRTVLIFGNEARLLGPEKIDADTRPTTMPNGTPLPAPKTSFEIFREKMENWFDSNMDRISGRLKKQYTRPITFWVAVVVTVAVNADTLAISRYLYNHPEQAKILADRAPAVARYVDSLRAVEPTQRTQQAYDTLIATLPPGLPLGWQRSEIDAGIGNAVWRHLVGWLATIMAIMLGAPFWFDLLGRISNLRGTGPRPPSSTDEQRRETRTAA